MRPSVAWNLEWATGTLGQTQNLGSNGPAFENRIFDLASLTKVIVTGTLLCLEASQKNDWTKLLAEPITTHLPELPADFKQVTVRHLLEHSSGLEAHRFLFEPKRHTPEKREDAWAVIVQQISQALKLGELNNTLYSDLDFLLLGLRLERVGGASLDVLWNEAKEKLGLVQSALSYKVEFRDFGRVAATEVRHARAEVNDDNAASLGGIAPHAGLFGTVLDVWAYLEALAKMAKKDRAFAQWVERPAVVPGRFYLGWDTPESVGGQVSQGGLGAPPETLGHLGYTGCALWWSPKILRAGLLFSNRVYPMHLASSQALIKRLRQEFFTALWHNEDIGGNASWSQSIKDLRD
jgi:CubicO group peptidase (beta-lactamase class C family)